MFGQSWTLCHLEAAILDAVKYNCICACRIIAFADSSYDTPAHIEEMELQGLRGDTILVEGIRTGAANVAVRLQDPAYRVSLFFPFLLIYETYLSPQSSELSVHEIQSVTIWQYYWVYLLASTVLFPGIFNFFIRKFKTFMSNSSVMVYLYINSIMLCMYVY